MTIHRNLNVNGLGGNYVHWWIIKTLKAAGWTVKASGSGTGGVYSSSSDVFDPSDNPKTESAATSIGVGVGQEHFGNSACWLRIEDPDGNRELLFVRSSTASDAADDEWWIGYSAAAGFTGGTPAAATPPSATDEESVSDAGTKGTPASQHQTGGSQNLIHVAADDSASPAGEYGFVCVELIATNTTKSITMLDDIRNAATGDPHALVLLHDSLVLTEANMYTADMMGKTIFDYGGTPSWANTTGGVPRVGSLFYGDKAGVSLYDSKERPFPLPLIGYTIGGYLGTSRWLRVPAQKRGYPNTGDSKTLLYLNDGMIVDLFDGATTPGTI